MNIKRYALVIAILVVVGFITGFYMARANAEMLTSTRHGENSSSVFAFDPNASQARGSVTYTEFLGQPINVVFGFTTHSINLEKIVRFIYLDWDDGTKSGLIEYDGQYYYLPNINPIPID